MVDNDPYAIHPEIVRAEENLERARGVLEAKIAAVQSDCGHMFVGEAPYEESTWCSDSKPPFRVCFTCGVREDGWGDGDVLWKRQRVVKITRHEGLKIWRRS